MQRAWYNINTTSLLFHYLIAKGSSMPARNSKRNKMAWSGSSQAKVTVPEEPEPKCQELPAASPRHQLLACGSARSEPTTTISYTSSFMLTRDSQEKVEITIKEYTMPKDSTTDDNQQGKRDASNMYVEMGFYMLVFDHPFIFSINLIKVRTTSRPFLLP